MSDYEVIADVGQTLVKLLKDSMKVDNKIKEIINPDNDIVLSSPDEIGGENDGRLILFLYQINENAFLKNQEMAAPDVKVQQQSPLVLDLFYLVISNTDKREKDHLLLGKVMQVFYDHGVLQGSVLQGGLAGSDEKLRLVLCSLPFDSMLSLWQSFPEKSFKLSLCYQITPISIESSIEREVQRVI